MEVKMVNKFFLHIIPIVVFVCVVPALSAESAITVDHTTYGKLLESHVKDGRVNYTTFKQDEADLDRYLAQLAAVDPEQLDRSEQMAFYINAYNAWTIKLILKNYPGVESIKDLGSLFQSPWKKKFVKINGKTMTLDNIEHDILRPVFKDPRVHFAVNCASISCPPLQDKPFTGADLERQLDAAAMSFINDPQSNFVRGDKLYVSRIFKWFGEDFGNDIPGYFRSHALGDLAKKMAKAGQKLKIQYLEYDWSLNDTVPND
jgi:hypothetical protein